MRRTIKDQPVLKPLRTLCIVAISAALAAATLFSTGCTGPIEYVHNGFKVGPNYHPPSAMIAEHWIDVKDRRVRSECDDLAAWWTVMNDPLLNEMMVYAYQQNLTLREAGFRVLEARTVCNRRRRVLSPIANLQRQFHPFRRWPKFLQPLEYEF